MYKLAWKTIVFFILCFFISDCQGGSEETTWSNRYPFIKNASTLASSSSSGYDYIIVGGGTAGCPLAATLSEKYRVLLLERGGLPFSNPNVSWLKNFHLSLADTSPSSAAQTFISTDGVINSRGRVLGGGSAINAGFYSRASSRYIRKAGWDARLVNQSYPWIEEKIVFKPKLAPWQKALKEALLEIGVSPDNGFSLDHKHGTKVGGTTFDSHGRRRTSADLLAFSNSENLTVLIHATVQRIIFTRDKDRDKPTAIGVIFKDENGVRRQADLSKEFTSEVIVSCGAIGSPQLLLLSGIGKKTKLSKLNISSVVENKFVGERMVDNPHNAIFIPSKKKVKQSLIQTVGVTSMGVYIESSSGFGQSSESIHCNHGILSAELGQLSTLPPKRRTPEAIRDYLSRKADLPREAFMGGFVLEKLASPLSTGKLELISTDIDENPSVTFNYFSHPRDLDRCVKGIRLLERVVKSKRFAYFANDQSTERLLNLSVKANVNLIPKHTDDTESLEQFCRDTVITIWHYHGGCHVGKVVDSDFRVLGVERLRVVDGSTFSESPGTNPQATVLMLGRYVGLKMVEQRRGKTMEVEN